jgi:hypothetical protein
MKGNFKKLTLFVMITVIAMFTVVGMASAGDHQWRKAIHGEYAFTGTGACIQAPGGFTEKFIPKIPELSKGPGTNFWDGVMTFEKDGTGSVSARHRYMDIPPNLGAGLVDFYWGFTYTVNRGKITFTEIPSTYYADFLEGPGSPSVLSNVAFSQTYDGYISADGKNLIVSLGVPLKLLPVGPPLCSETNLNCIEIICSGTFQGFRTEDE